MSPTFSKLKLALPTFALAGLLAIACGPSSSASPTSSIGIVPTDSVSTPADGAPTTGTEPTDGGVAPTDAAAPSDGGTPPDSSASPGVSPGASPGDGGEGVEPPSSAIALVDLAGTVTTYTSGTCELASGTGAPIAAGEAFDTALLTINFEPAEAEAEAEAGTVLPLTLSLYLQERATELAPTEPGEPAESPSADASASPDAGTTVLPFAVSPTALDIASLPGDEAASDAVTIGGTVVSNGLAGTVFLTASTGDPMTITFACAENSAEEPILTPTQSPGASPEASPAAPTESPTTSPESSPGASPSASPS